MLRFVFYPPHKINALSHPSPTPPDPKLGPPISPDISYVRYCDLVRIISYESESVFVFIVIYIGYTCTNID